MDAGLLRGKPYRMTAVETTCEMMDAVQSELSPGAVLIMSAAPADYAPMEKQTVKIKKAAEELCVKLKANPDILKAVAKRRALEPGLRDLFVVGFAAETNNVEEFALAKLREKDLDMICLNDVGRAGAGFSVDTNIITIFTRGNGKEELPLLSKSEAAARIIGRIETEIKKRGY
jgi:phosphopantothenoylcysteine decarboxylase/phosphopantothenate--cysteine ligase